MKKKKSGLITAIVIIAVIAILAGAAAFAGWRISSGDKVLPNVYVGDILVGGLTKDQTALALEQRGWKERTTEPLTVSLPAGVSFDVDSVVSGGALSIDDAVNAAYTYGHNGNIFENLITYIELMFKSVDVNELCKVENEQYIDSCIAESLKEYEAGLGESEYVFNNDNATVTMKKGWGQTKFDVKELKEKINWALSGGETALQFNKLENELTLPDFVAIRDELDITPVNAEYTDDNQFGIVSETDGAKLDVSKATELWNKAGLGETVVIPVELVKPEVTNEMLEGRLFHDMLGAMSTRYTNSAENRCSNVRLCASKINEFIVYPGEEFSYNGVVGKRTEEAGFLPAPAYVGLDGEETVKDEIGGGACQVSSTLYAATLFAFLETVERTCHIYPVNYMQIGIDATVTIPEDGQEMNFKFRNNKNYPVKIVAYTEENEEEKKLTIEIWGTLEDTDYMPVEFDASWTWEQDYDRTIEPAYADRVGYKIQLTHDTYSGEDELGPTITTQTHRVVYDSEGNEIANDITNMLNANGEHTMDIYHRHG